MHAPYLGALRALMALELQPAHAVPRPGEAERDQRAHQIRQLEKQVAPRGQRGAQQKPEEQERLQIDFQACALAFMREPGTGTLSIISWTTWLVMTFFRRAAGLMIMRWAS